MTRPDPRNVCDGCGGSLDQRLRSHVGLGPIVHDHIWQQLAEASERLCDACMYQRAWDRLGRIADAHRPAAVSVESISSAALVVRLVHAGRARAATQSH
jgi:hypothetical protein